MPYVQTDFDVPIPNIIHTGCPHYYRFAQEGESEQDFVDRLARELDELIVKEGPDTVSALIGETLQGAGRVLVAPHGSWEKIQAVLRKPVLLHIPDDATTRSKHTGTLFSCQPFATTPPIPPLD